MTRSNHPPSSGREPAGSGESQPYPGQPLGLPEHGPGSLARMGRRLVALMVDWSIAVGLAGLAVPFGHAQTVPYLISGGWINTASVIWLVLGIVAVRLFTFTPGQFVLGIRVASVDERMYVGIGRAAARVVLIAFVIPALFVDVDGRGIQDRVTATAVVFR
jgi:RDD family